MQHPLRRLQNVGTVVYATDICRPKWILPRVVLEQLVHRLSPGSLSLRGHPMAEAMGGRCPRLERFEFGLVNRRPSFRAPEWVDLNFRSFSLRGKGLEQLTRWGSPESPTFEARPHLSRYRSRSVLL